LGIARGRYCSTGLRYEGRDPVDGPMANIKMFAGDRESTPAGSCFKSR